MSGAGPLTRMGNAMDATPTDSRRLESLSRRHAELEERLREAYARPGPNEAEVRRIKVAKLRLKEEMHRILAAT